MSKKIRYVVLFAIVLLILGVVGTLTVQRNKSIWNELHVKSYSAVTEINVIRSSGGMMNSVSAEKNLNLGDRKEFFDLIARTDKVINKKDEVYQLNGYQAKEEYFRMKISGKEVYIKALLTNGKLEILDEDGKSVGNFYLDEIHSQKLLDMINKYNPFYRGADM